MQIPEQIPQEIFRAYDIRGIVDKTLTPAIVYAIGRAIGSAMRAEQQTCLVLGRDGRLSGETFAKALAEGAQDAGVDVIDVGQVPTPVLYYAIEAFSTGNGVMITGSHNPPDYNGIKMVVNKTTLTSESIQALYTRLQTGDLTEGSGTYETRTIVPDYYQRVTSDVTLARPLKVVIDCGNGIPGAVAPTLFRKLGCEVTELFCEVDGTFPNHHPDPVVPENLTDLIAAVKAEQADIGLAFDGDGDRLGVVTNTGDIIAADRLLILLAKAVLAKNPGAKITYDVKCTRHLPAQVTAVGGEPIICRTGHSYAKAKLQEVGAALGGEFSGHIFYKERWYGFDDALYTGARLLEIIASDTQTASEHFAKIPSSVCTPEIHITVPEADKFDLMAQLVNTAHFPDAEAIIDIDGLRVEFADGWGLVRPSNTTPVLVLRFEADTEGALARIQQAFRQALTAVATSLTF